MSRPMTVACRSSDTTAPNHQEKGKCKGLISAFLKLQHQLCFVNSANHTGVSSQVCLGCLTVPGHLCLGGSLPLDGASREDP